MPDPKFSWSVSRREYVYPNGKPVPAETLDAWIATAADNAEARMRAIGQRFADGEINFAQWVIDSKNEIQVAARGMAQMAYGGKLTAKQKGKLGQMVKAQYSYFNDFAALTESGEIQPGQALIGRNGLYGSNAYPIYQMFVGDRERSVGMKEVRNILGSRGKSCPGCINESAKGWQKLKNWIPIGARECVSRCRCRAEYRQGPTDSES